MRNCPAVAARRDGMGSARRKRRWDGMPKACQKDQALLSHLQPPKMPLTASRDWAEMRAGTKGHVPDAEEGCGEQVAGKTGKYCIKAPRDVSEPRCPGMGQRSLDPWPLPNWCYKAVPGELLPPLGSCSWLRQILVAEPGRDLAATSTKLSSDGESHE